MKSNDKQEHTHWFTSASNDYECPLCGEKFDLPIEPVFVDIDDGTETDLDHD